MIRFPSKKNKKREQIFSNKKTVFPNLCASPKDRYLHVDNHLIIRENACIPSINLNK